MLLLNENLSGRQTEAVNSLGEVGKAAAEKNLKSEAEQAIGSLRWIGGIANKHKFEDTKLWIEAAIKKTNAALSSKSQQE